MQQENDRKRISACAACPPLILGSGQSTHESGSLAYFERHAKQMLQKDPGDMLHRFIHHFLLLPHHRLSQCGEVRWLFRLSYSLSFLTLHDPLILVNYLCTEKAFTGRIRFTETLLKR